MQLIARWLFALLAGAAVRVTLAADWEWVPALAATLAVLELFERY